MYLGTQEIVWHFPSQLFSEFRWRHILCMGIGLGNGFYNLICSNAVVLRKIFVPFKKLYHRICAGEHQMSLRIYLPQCQ